MRTGTNGAGFETKVENALVTVHASGKMVCAETVTWVSARAGYELPINTDGDAND